MCVFVILSLKGISTHIDPEAAVSRYHLCHLEFRTKQANNLVSQIESPIDTFWLIQLELLKLLTMYLTLKHFSLHFTGNYILIRMDNMATEAYINRKGELRSAQVCHLAAKFSSGLICSCYMQFTSAMNCGTEAVRQPWTERFIPKWCG